MTGLKEDSFVIVQAGVQEKGKRHRATSRPKRRGEEKGPQRDVVSRRGGGAAAREACDRRSREVVHMNAAGEDLNEGAVLRGGAYMARGEGVEENGGGLERGGSDTNRTRNTLLQILAPAHSTYACDTWQPAAHSAAVHMSRHSRRRRRHHSKARRKDEKKEGQLKSPRSQPRQWRRRTDGLKAGKGEVKGVRERGDVHRPRLHRETQHWTRSAGRGEGAGKNGVPLHNRKRGQPSSAEHTTLRRLCSRSGRCTEPCTGATQRRQRGESKLGGSEERRHGDA